MDDRICFQKNKNFFLWIALMVIYSILPAHLSGQATVSRMGSTTYMKNLKDDHANLTGNTNSLYDTRNNLTGNPASMKDGKIILKDAKNAIYKTLLPHQAQKSATDSFYFSIGERHAVSYNLHESGEQIVMPDGGSLYRMGFTSPGALFMDISYRHFQLEEKAELYVCNPQNGMVFGPYTSENVSDSQEFSTDIVKGDSIVILCYEPANSQGKSRIEPRCVVAGTKGFFNSDESATCLINTACEEAEAYRDIIRSVVLIYMDGYLCSGNLINNTAQDGTPYILSAAHCIEELSTSHSGSWKFFFNIEAYQCNGNDGPSPYDYGLQTRTGCQVVAKGTKSDFLLLKLNQSIPSSYNAYYCGWDRRNQAPTKGLVGIHHPHGDFKKFSQTSQTPTTNNCSSIGYDRMAFWYFYWEKGVCEQGSSGSGLFNAETKRLIGTLTAINNVGCTTNLRSRLNWYGKLSYHWFANNENSQKEQLRPWLDPTGSNALYIDGSYQPSATSVPEAEKTSRIDVFPNPATDKIQIRIPENTEFLETLENGIGEICIYTANGAKIRQIQCNSQNCEIEISHLAKGVYFIEIPGYGHAKFIKL